tara:strand:+ start:269 stop:406 length:138 start_codon:yes stop_codon:yes gene_type:complete
MVEVVAELKLDVVKGQETHLLLVHLKEIMVVPVQDLEEVEVAQEQ